MSVKYCSILIFGPKKTDVCTFNTITNGFVRSIAVPEGQKISSFLDFPSTLLRAALDELPGYELFM